MVYSGRIIDVTLAVLNGVLRFLSGVAVFSISLDVKVLSRTPIFDGLPILLFFLSYLPVEFQPFKPRDLPAKKLSLSPVAQISKVSVLCCHQVKAGTRH